MIRFLTTFISFSLFIWSPFQFSVDNVVFVLLCFFFRWLGRSLALPRSAKQLSEEKLWILVEMVLKINQKSFPWKCDAQEKERKSDGVMCERRQTVVEPQSKSLAAATNSKHTLSKTTMSTMSTWCDRAMSPTTPPYFPWCNAMAFSSWFTLPTKIYISFVWCDLMLLLLLLLLLMVFIFLFLFTCSMFIHGQFITQTFILTE